MPKTKERIAGAAGSAKPYVERALHDEELREHVKQAYGAARQIYEELVGPRGVSRFASRVAGDGEIHDNLRTAVSELRRAADRLQGPPRRHAGRNVLLVLIGIAIGLLLNPVTGPETRRWLKQKLSGGDAEFGVEDQSGDGTGS